MHLVFAVAHEEAGLPVLKCRSYKANALDEIENVVILLAIKLSHRLDFLVYLISEKVLDVVIVYLINI